MTTLTILKGNNALLSGGAKNTRFAMTLALRYLRPGWRAEIVTSRKRTLQGKLRGRHSIAWRTV